MGLWQRAGPENLSPLLASARSRPKKGTCLGHFIEISYELDLEVVGLQNIAFAGKKFAVSV